MKMIKVLVIVAYWADVTVQYSVSERFLLIETLSRPAYVETSAYIKYVVIDFQEKVQHEISSDKQIRDEKKFTPLKKEKWSLNKKRIIAIEDDGFEHYLGIKCKKIKCIENIENSFLMKDSISVRWKLVTDLPSIRELVRDESFLGTLGFYQKDEDGDTHEFEMKCFTEDEAGNAYVINKIQSIEVKEIDINIINELLKIPSR